MVGPESEQPSASGNSEGAEHVDYEQMFADAKKEAATEQGSILPATAEISQILNRTNRQEATEGIEEQNQQSLGALESGTNNTGVNNKEFARSQLLATLYAARGYALDRTMYDSEGSAVSAQTAEELMTKTLAEADMWERAAKGEPLTPEEESLVRGRALSIRKAAAERAATTGVEPTSQSPETEMNQEQTPLERAMVQVPDDSLERRKFGENNLEQQDAAKLELLKAYLIKEARDWAARVPEGTRYPDTLAGILGNGTRGPIRFLGAMVITREGMHELDLHELASRSFSETVRSYLDLDIRREIPDFDQKFG